MSLARIKIESRVDGEYLTIPSDVQDVDPREIEIQLIKKGVMNIPSSKIKDALSRKTGKAQKISKPFEYYDHTKDELFELDIKPEAVRLILNNKITENGMPLLLADDIFYSLNLKGIVFGIDKKNIFSAIVDMRLNHPYLIASAVGAVKGLDAKIEETIKIEGESRPLNLSGGKVDFKSLDLIQQVEEGMTLARRYLPTLGVDGMDVFGNVLKAAQGMDLDLPAGENTRIEEDNTRLISETGGYLFRKGGKIHVGKLYYISGDVNFSTGNVKYRGDVLVTGNVLSDFTIEAEGDILIKGEVEAANKIHSRHGNVQIKGGCFREKKN